MKEKIYNVLNKIYGIAILVSLFAGCLPVIPFIIAIIIGGDFGANMSVFIYKQYYPWVAVLSAFAVIVGIVAMYIGKRITFSLPSWMKKKNDNSESNQENSKVNDEASKIDESKDVK